MVPENIHEMKSKRSEVCLIAMVKATFKEMEMPWGSLQGTEYMMVY